MCRHTSKCPQHICWYDLGYRVAKGVDPVRLNPKCFVAAGGGAPDGRPAHALSNPLAGSLGTSVPAQGLPQRPREPLEHQVGGLYISQGSLLQLQQQQHQQQQQQQALQDTSRRDLLSMYQVDILNVMG